MAKETEFVSETQTEITFRFVCECEDCDAEGDLTLDKKDGHKPFGCPEGCGATYVPWQNPLNHGRWELKCVVLPHYYPRNERSEVSG